MMGMGSDQKKMGSVILALAGGLKPKSKVEDAESEKMELCKLCAERVIAAIKDGDAEALLTELPKLLNVLPEPQMEQEND